MKHKTLTILLVVLMSIAASVASAHDFEVDGIYYNITSSNTVAVTFQGDSYDAYSNEYSGKVVIPESVMYDDITYNVTSISDGTFYGCSRLTTISIPSSVIKIGNEAFYDTAWYENQPNGVVYAGKVAYKYKGTMQNTEIVLEEGTLGIADYAFESCSPLTSISIPNSVISIGRNALFNCTNLVSVSIPNSVVRIGFQAFSGCRALTTITIGNSVLSIDACAFENCYNLASVIIPNSVTEIGTKAFYNCYHLVSVTIGESVVEIGRDAFSSCYGLTSITIPNSVTRIGDGAFNGCSALENIIVGSDNLVYDSRESCNAIIKTTSNMLIRGCINTVIPNDVTTIGKRAFDYCKGQTSVTIPNSVTTIEDYAFSHCRDIASLDLSNNLATIGNYAFCYCDALASVSIPNSVISIGEGAFQDCWSLSSISVGNSVTKIFRYAFEDCHSLTDFYCFAKNVPTMQSPVFDYTPTSAAILHVPAISFDDYAATLPWSGFGSIVPISSSIALADGIVYANGTDTEYDEFTYSRNFSNTEWQALYVPFEMSYEDWKDEFEVARLNNVNQYDDNEDGVIDRTLLEVFKVKDDTIKANTPYLIKAKATGEKTISLTNTTLYKAEDNSIDCSSVGTLYTFTGTYSGIDGATMVANGYYAVSDGCLNKVNDSANALCPMRWYMSATDREGNIQDLGEVKIMVFGEDVDGVNEPIFGWKEETIYDPNGRKLAKMQKGINIVRMSDGTVKKVMVK